MTEIGWYIHGHSGLLVVQEWIFELYSCGNVGYGKVIDTETMYCERANERIDEGIRTHSHIF